MKNQTKFTSFALLVIGVLQTALILFIASCNAPYIIDNPYKNVQWDKHRQYKANFHTHTTCSDGRLNPHTVVDRYAELGYSILAITDHNLVTYPWTAFDELKPSNKTLRRIETSPKAMPKDFVFENRDPSILNIIDIQANELSRHHHIGSFFNNHNGPKYEEEIDYEITENESLSAVAQHYGIAMLYHPGRYNQPVDWYVSLYANHSHLIGQELYNQGDRYPSDRALWDSILTVTMPRRPVWGYSNDDMHVSEHIGRNWNVLILPELSYEWVRKGMENGLSYYVYSPQGHSGPNPPIIKSIAVNQKKGTITIDVDDYEKILWIANADIIKEGRNINISNIKGHYNYVRAEIYGKGGSIVGTQPFGLNLK